MYIFITLPKIEIFEQFLGLNNLKFDGQSKYMHQINKKTFFGIVAYFLCEKYHCEVSKKEQYFLTFLEKMDALQCS